MIEAEDDEEANDEADLLSSTVFSKSDSPAVVSFLGRSFSERNFTLSVP